jgi:hypothetical protein
VVTVLAPGQMRLQDRRFSLLELQEQRVVVVTSHEQGNVAMGTHTANPNCFERRIH